MGKSGRKIFPVSLEVKMDLIEKAYNLCKKIVAKKPKNFSGIGIVAYETNVFDETLHCDLRPGIICKPYSIEEDAVVDYLVNIADYHSILHDGFHMINEKGILTHVAQYFVPPVIKEIEPNQDHGVRLYSSLCGSTLEGVIFIATICTDMSIYILKNGKVYRKKGGMLYV